MCKWNFSCVMEIFNINHVVGEMEYILKCNWHQSQLYLQGHWPTMHLRYYKFQNVALTKDLAGPDARISNDLLIWGQNWQHSSRCVHQSIKQGLPIHFYGSGMRQICIPPIDHWHLLWPVAMRRLPPINRKCTRNIIIIWWLKRVFLLSSNWFIFS